MGCRASSETKASLVQKDNKAEGQKPVKKIKRELEINPDDQDLQVDTQEYDSELEFELQQQNAEENQFQFDLYERKKYKPEDRETAYNLFDDQLKPNKGDIAMLNKPYVGTLVPPMNPPPINNYEPSQKLQLEYIYGYRCFDSRQNLFFTSQGTLVYPAASIGVVFDVKNNTQDFFGGGFEDRNDGHMDDITALAIHPKKQIIATGEVGKNPKICIWKANQPSKAQIEFQQGKGSKAVTALAFSNFANGKLLASSAYDKNNTVRVWDWSSGNKIAELKSGSYKILGLS